MVRGQAAQVHNIKGAASEFHSRDLPFTDSIGIWVCEVTTAAVVLGSRQDMGVVNAAGAAAGGFEVVRRRSGGTMVHLIPTEVLWVDVLVPAGDRRLRADLRASMMWMGEQWASVLERMLTEHVPPVQQSASAEVNGEDGPQIAVYEGPLQTSPWADLLCFGGLGPGEVTVDGAKLVGISQRRTRAGARFQMAIHRRFEIADLADVWAAPPPAPQDLPPVATLERFGPIVDLDLVDLLASELSA